MKKAEIYFECSYFNKYIVQRDYDDMANGVKIEAKCHSFTRFGRSISLTRVIDKKIGPKRKVEEELTMDERDDLYIHLTNLIDACNHDKKEKLLHMDSVSQALYYVYRDASRLAQAYGTCFTPSELQGGDFRKHIEYLKKNGKYVCQDNDDIKKFIINYSNRYGENDIKYIFTCLEESLGEFLKKLNIILAETYKSDAVAVDAVGITIDAYNKFS